MFGKNNILKPQNHSGDNLNIVEIFPTLQGEGPYVGYPSVFVRLGGCNLACEFCDTQFDEFKTIWVDEILEQVEEISKNQQNKRVRNLVVITGGEPLRQPIEKLCQRLIDAGFLVQIETNGTLFRDLPKEVKIICSPKMSNGKYYEIRADLLERIDALKFIISKNDQDYHFVPDWNCDIPIYVQPMDEYDAVKNKDNVKYASKLAQENDYILSLQMHKILDIP